jgi:hypothetical protein
MPPVSEKNANMDVCIFFYFSATSYGWWRTFPFEPFMKGLRLERP